MPAMRMPPCARDISETADGCQSGNAFVGGRQVCEDRNTFSYRLVAICKDIAERMLFLWVEPTGSSNTCSGPCPSAVLDIATPTRRWISSWLSLWDLPPFKVSGISQHGEETAVVSTIRPPFLEGGSLEPTFFPLLCRPKPQRLHPNQITSTPVEPPRAALRPANPPRLRLSPFRT